MEITRREALAGGLVVTSLGLAGRGHAAGGELTVVSDGRLTLPEAMLTGGGDRAALDAAMAASGFDLDPLAPPCNLTLLRTDDRVVLFDAGAGPEFMATTGEVPYALKEAGVRLDEVTDVVMTHGHPDHLWGVLDDFGDPTFPEATIHMPATEMAYWTDPATVETIGELRQAFAVGAARRLAEMGDRVAVFADDGEPVPGVRALPTFGHTPGHVSYLLPDGAVVIGDAVANPHLAMRDPGGSHANDQDPERAARSRVDLLTRLASDGAAAVGFHLPGGLGTVARDGDAFLWRPA
ncbi:MBL fold metallo-hydrolase [Jannaschia sp. Os4]|uniref:MBL fold metallo-hydrolase n=1 Tax=Jannaschia sp. Os4 TaxID=2807617 RepID=UPI00193AB195|nr:MBL fold metallo-hydrolase [Jannaschia sp. Os4]MBM2576308.1 MBL fold metallo-hydrolase [Jannaschia sp. Os4]